MTCARNLAASLFLTGCFAALAAAQGMPPQPPQTAPSPQTQAQPSDSQSPKQGNSPAPQGGVKEGKCREEFEAACPGMHPGDGKWGPCMKEHKDQLSPRCKRKLGKMSRRAKRRGHHAGGKDGGKSEGGKESEGEN